MTIVKGRVVKNCVECELLHRICYRLLWNERMPEEGTRKRASDCDFFQPDSGIYELNLKTRPYTWKTRR